tara:strand:- start:14939 stop:15223 length:285 start_codon:yes stop_codon:yes gene_type:complete
MFTATNILLAFLLINAWTFVMFGWDKYCSETGRWRVPEATLIGWSLFGGTPGAYLARRVFRHKTRKQPFSEYLKGIAILHLFAGFAAVLYWGTR